MVVSFLTQLPVVCMSAQSRVKQTYQVGPALSASAKVVRLAHYQVHLASSMFHRLHGRTKRGGITDSVVWHEVLFCAHYVSTDTRLMVEQSWELWHSLPALYLWNVRPCSSTYS